MTGMLASVLNLQEAKIALQENVDIIDLKDPAQGALGAVDVDVVATVVDFVAGRCLLSATVGDLPMQAQLIADAVSAMAETGVDFVKVGVFGELTDAVIAGLKQQAMRSVHDVNGKQFAIVMVFLVDQAIDEQRLSDLARAGIRGVMLDTADKESGNLRQYADDETLRSFVIEAQSLGLLVGLAGSLQIDDVLPLHELGVDYLGFRGALCKDNIRIQGLNPVAIRDIRRVLGSDQGCVSL